MYDGTTRTNYIDGWWAGSNTPVANSHIVPAGTEFKLGVSDFAASTPGFRETYYFNGIMDHVAIYSSALTTAQLATLRLGILL